MTAPKRLLPVAALIILVALSLLLIATSQSLAIEGKPAGDFFAHELGLAACEEGTLQALAQS